MIAFILLLAMALTTPAVAFLSLGPIGVLNVDRLSASEISVNHLKTNVLEIQGTQLELRDIIKNCDYFAEGPQEYYSCKDFENTGIISVLKTCFIEDGKLRRLLFYCDFASADGPWTRVFALDAAVSPSTSSSFWVTNTHYGSTGGSLDITDAFYMTNFTTSRVHLNGVQKYTGTSDVMPNYSFASYLNDTSLPTIYLAGGSGSHADKLQLAHATSSNIYYQYYDLVSVTFASGPCTYKEMSFCWMQFGQDSSLWDGNAVIRDGTYNWKYQSTSTPFLVEVWVK